MTNLLRFAGKNGAWVVISGVVLGFCFPILSATARPYLAIAIFLFTFGSFLKLDFAALREQLAQTRATVLMVLWATFGVPLVVFACIMLFRPGPDLTQGLLFWSLVPTSPACVAFAAILGLRTSLALLATVAATAASPFYMPWLAAALGGYQVTVNPASMSFQLLLIVGGAGAAAMLVKRFAGSFVQHNPDAMTGIAVFALVLAGMGSMRGMQAYFLAQPVVTLKLLLLAYTVTLGFQCLGSLLFWRSSRDSALTAGLISGTRTITLAWVVLGSDVLPLADVFFAVGMVAKYTCPALTKVLIARLNTRQATPLVPIAQSHT
jgi:BASS family bile acid:Na+ symporter